MNPRIPTTTAHGRASSAAHTAKNHAHNDMSIFAASLRADATDQLSMSADVTGKPTSRPQLNPRTLPRPPVAPSSQAGRIDRLRDQLDRIATRLARPADAGAFQRLLTDEPILEKAEDLLGAIETKLREPKAVNRDTAFPAHSAAQPDNTGGDSALRGRLMETGPVMFSNLFSGASANLALLGLLTELPAATESTLARLEPEAAAILSEDVAPMTITPERANLPQSGKRRADQDQGAVSKKARHNDSDIETATEPVRPSPPQSRKRRADQNQEPVLKKARRDDYGGESDSAEATVSGARPVPAAIPPLDLSKARTPVVRANRSVRDEKAEQLKRARRNEGSQRRFSQELGTVTKALAQASETVAVFTPRAGLVRRKNVYRKRRPTPKLDRTRTPVTTPRAADSNEETSGRNYTPYRPVENGIVRQERPAAAAPPLRLPPATAITTPLEKTVQAASEAPAQAPERKVVRPQARPRPLLPSPREDTGELDTPAARKNT